jgi:hypothetical protein|tara:strand:- start:849 stop:1154 length:306 start_codon:yes stop_codon:yes gene_type:complete
MNTRALDQRLLTCETGIYVSTGAALGQPELHGHTATGREVWLDGLCDHLNVLRMLGVELVGDLVFELGRNRVVVVPLGVEIRISLRNHKKRVEHSTGALAK